MGDSVKAVLIALLAALACAAQPAAAALSVFACEPEWAALASELGGDRVKVYAATTAQQNVHRIEARPSLIARARSADLAVCTGAELEAGWLPVVLRESANPRIQPGRPGYFEAAALVPTLEKPERLDRAQGDVHPLGNPHVQTDPRNILLVADALTKRLTELAPADAMYLLERSQSFRARWQAAIARWQAQAAPLRGLPVAVQHRAFSYLIAWLGMREVATLEPRPGVEPSVAHLGQVLEGLKAQPARLVLRAAYDNPRPSAWLAERSGLPVVVLPFTVGGSEQAGDLFALFDDTLARLLAAAR